MKVSELKNEVVGMREQVTEIWAEQKARFDDLTAAFTALQESLGDADLDADTTTEIEALKVLITAFNDAIPSVEPDPVPTPDPETTA